MTIESMHNEERVFSPSLKIQKKSTISGMSSYKKLCKKAAADYEGFWSSLAKELLIWDKPFTKVLNEENAPFYKWFEDGRLNASYNCLDRHLKNKSDKIAIISEGDNGTVTRITYRNLYEKVCQFANGLKSLGMESGDTVVIYLPMTIEAVVAMQACARIGLIHSVIFGGFSAKSIQDRVADVKAKLIITSDVQFRGGKCIPLKPAIDGAIETGECKSVKNVIVWNRTKIKPQRKNYEVDWQDLISGMSLHCDPVSVCSEHPLFILYTSGSTGKPKGVQHQQAFTRINDDSESYHSEF